MKAIISDIHGNLTALDAVLADIKTLEIEEIICLGDVVGYGPRPRECMERLAECDPILLGNHEEAVLDADAAAAFNDRARRAVEWTRKQLFESVNGEDEETVLARRRRLESFQRGIQEDGIQYVHASPRDPTREYITPRDAENPVKMANIFKKLKWVCFVGHTHMPGVFTETGFTKPDDLLGNIYLLDPGEKALINVGSVGQPRDRDPRACYAMFDGDSVRWRRVEYDIEQTVQQIAEIPEIDDFLGERLREGR